MSQHVVMIVGNTLETDARVRKSALAVAEMGYRVTVLYGDADVAAPVEGRLGPVRTVAVPVRYRRREKTLDRWKRAREWRLPGLRDEPQAGGSGVRGVARRARRGAWRVQRAALTRIWPRLDRLRHDSLPRTWRRELGNIVDLDEAFRPLLHAERPDIIHAHDIHLLETAVRERRSSNGRVRVLYDAHEYVPGTVQLTEIEAEAVKQMERALIGDVDSVVTVSEPIARALQEVYHLADRPVVVLNSPSATAAPADPGTTVRAAAGLPPDTPLLVYSGVVNPKRGLPTVIQALHHAPGVHLAVVCVPGPEHWRAQRLLKVAAKAGVSDRVHLLPPVATDAITHYLSDADLGVHPLAAGLPNHEMALPNKLFDYLFSGLPVVVTDVALMGGFVRERGVGVTFADGDAADCARAVRDALGQIEELRGAVRQPQLREEVGWERQVEALERVYERLARR